MAEMERHVCLGRSKRAFGHIFQLHVKTSLRELLPFKVSVKSHKILPSSLQFTLQVIKGAQERRGRRLG